MTYTERFISTVQSESLQNRLWWAIEGRGAFRRFRDGRLEDG